ERQAIGSVSVDLVCGSKNKRRFGRKFSGRFEKVKRAICVHGEIGFRIARSPIMRRLRGGVNDRGDVPLVLLEQVVNSLAIANINLMMLVSANIFDQIVTGLSG